MQSSHFWESRAQQYASDGEGLAAVCSFAMPAFYNRAIDITQRSALRRVLRSIRPGDRVLDYGCGIGRWSAEMAKRGAEVTAVDFSASMLVEAQRRLKALGLSDRCRFIHHDICSFDSQERFDLIFGVTVLQHVLDDSRLTQTVSRFCTMLKPGGRLVMVEAAPSVANRSGDTPTFRARPLDRYLTVVDDAGLLRAEVRGVDPAPFKLWVVPRFRTWPRPLALAALAAAALLALPFDLLLAARLVHHSWHKIIIASAPGVET